MILLCIKKHKYWIVLIVKSSILDIKLTRNTLVWYRNIWYICREYIVQDSRYSISICRNRKKNEIVKIFWQQKKVIKKVTYNLFLDVNGLYLALFQTTRLTLLFKRAEVEPYIKFTYSFHNTHNNKSIKTKENQLKCKQKI